MATNKVVYGNQTLIDLTPDTLTASVLGRGYTAHDRGGNPIIGTADLGGAVWGNITGDIDDQTDLQEEFNDVWKANGILGAKNFWLDDLYNHFTAQYDATFSVSNRELTISMASTESSGVYISGNNWLKPAFANITTPCILSVDVKGDSAFACRVQLNGAIVAREVTSAWQTFSLIITDPSQMASCAFVNSSGAAHIIYARNYMLRLADDSDETYRPYAKTNRELTVEKYDINDVELGAIADDDYFPLYDTSVMTSKKTLWANIKSKLKVYFDTLYQGILGTSSDISIRKLTAKVIANAVTGSGTAGRDAGEGVSPRYFPAKWTFNISGVTLANGQKFLIKIPVAGITYGVYMSIDNGTTYKPVITQGTTRLTTHYGNGVFIEVVYDSSASAANIYPVNGGDTSGTVSGGAFRVLNFYDANSNVTQTATTTNANYEVLFSATADNTTRTEGARKNNNLKFNPSTGNLQTTQLNGVTVGSSPKFTDTQPNNATLTIQKNGTTVKSFTANASSNVTCNITVPELTTQDFSWNNTPITAASAAGAYWTGGSNYFSVAKSGYTPVAVYITDFGMAKANFNVFLNGNNLAAMSDISQTVGQIKVKVLYIKS